MDEFEQKKLEHGRALRDMKRYQQALEIFIPLYTKEPGNIEVCKEVTFSLVESEQSEDALDFAQKLVVLDPDDSYCYYMLALAWQQNKRLTKAIEAAERCLELDPEFVYIYSLISSIKGDLGLTNEALHYAEKGLAIEPLHYTCLSHKMLNLAKLRRLDELGMTVEMAMSQYPSSGYVHYIKGWYHMLRIEPRQSREAFQVALRIDPTAKGYEEDMLQALRDSNPMRYFGLKVERLFKLHGNKLAIGILVLLAIDVFVTRFIWPNPPVAFFVVGAIILLVLYVLSRLSLRISDPYTNLYLWVKPETKHFLTRSDKTFVIVVSVITILMIAGFISLGFPFLIGIFFLFAVMDTMVRVSNRF